jgi:hypothetical protein
MIPLLLGAAALIVFLMLGRLYTTASTPALAHGIRTFSGIAAVVLGGVMIATGRYFTAAFLLLLGFGVLGGFLGRGSVERDLNRGPAAGREDFKRDTRARHRNPARKSAMTEDEAYEVLGLDARAGPEEIRRAHRTLMKKVHPDQGGSDWLASRINQARDILMRTRR